MAASSSLPEKRCTVRRTWGRSRRRWPAAARLPGLFWRLIILQTLEARRLGVCEAVAQARTAAGTRLPEPASRPQVHDQTAAHGKVVGTRLQFADHAAMARSFGVHAERVDTEDRLKPD